MTPRKAFAYVALWAILTAYFVAFERHSTSSDMTPPERPRLLDFAAADVAAVELRADGRHLRCERDGNGWRVTTPAGAELPADLIKTLVNALTEEEAVEVVSHDPAQAAEFGLVQPTSQVSVTTREGSRATVFLGARNPAQTAVYARRDGASDILLVGLNLEYYIELAMAGAMGT